MALTWGGISIASRPAAQAEQAIDDLVALTRRSPVFGFPVLVLRPEQYEYALGSYKEFERVYKKDVLRFLGVGGNQLEEAEATAKRMTGYVTRGLTRIFFGETAVTYPKQMSTNHLVREYSSGTSLFASDNVIKDIYDDLRERCENPQDLNASCWVRGSYLNVVMPHKNINVTASMNRYFSTQGVGQFDDEVNTVLRFHALSHELGHVVRQENSDNGVGEEGCDRVAAMAARQAFGNHIALGIHADERAMRSVIIANTAKGRQENEKYGWPTVMATDCIISLPQDKIDTFTETDFIKAAQVRMNTRASLVESAAAEISRAAPAAWDSKDLKALAGATYNFNRRTIHSGDPTFVGDMIDRFHIAAHRLSTGVAAYQQPYKPERKIDKADLYYYL